MAASEFLDGLWYLAATSRELKRDQPLRRILFGDPVALARTKAGVFALRDVCPHRAAPLSGGRIREHAGEPVIECPYHGWRFRLFDGRCAAAPALASDSGIDPSAIAATHFRLHEANGLVWIYRGEGALETEPPDIGLGETFRPKTITTVAASGPYDEAVIGLVDPAHTPTVHRQWWWREGAPRRDKTKYYEPAPLGFRMAAHRPSSNTRIYRLFGSATTEIEFRLPGIRLEHIRTGNRRILGLTAMTPADENETRVTHALFWDLPLLDIVRPVAQAMSDSFLAQDGAILRLQNENLSRLDHRALYLGDPDEPAKWYLRLKRAWRERNEAGGFKPPPGPSSLRWRT